MSLFSFEAIDTQNFLEFVIRFIFNFLIIYILAGKIYFKVRKRSNVLFALFMLNILVFFVCHLLQSVQISIGFAFGIFAIFSILRYRTSTVPIKEMTYIFISITLGVVNALTNASTGYVTMLFTNIVILLFAYLFEKIFIKDESTKVILYERIDLIRPDKRKELQKDLEERTGLKINRFDIGRIDFMRDTARITIYYYDKNYSSDSEITEDYN